MTVDSSFTKDEVEVNDHRAPIEILSDWGITPDGRFLHKAEKRVLSRIDWEIEISYEHSSKPEVLALAKVLSDQAASLSK